MRCLLTLIEAFRFWISSSVLSVDEEASDKLTALVIFQRDTDHSRFRLRHGSIDIVFVRTRIVVKSVIQRREHRALKYEGTL